MTVTDPDVPDPLNDPRTLQADPGAVAEGEDLASTEDDQVATGEDELQAGQTLADDAGGGDVTGGAVSALASRETQRLSGPSSGSGQPRSPRRDRWPPVRPASRTSP